ncbi:MAG: class I SAM-dependent methyltransferase [Pseudomonadota bacterium]
MVRSITLCMLLIVAAGCSSPAQDAVEASGADTLYEQVRASRDGIGKRYMDREISQVMGHRGAAWLERPQREREERTDLLIENMTLTADAVVADIGAGTGYFSLELAERVPDGKVLAVDIQPEMLEIIEARTQELGVTNIEPVLGTERDPQLPTDGVDVVLLVDAYHEFAYPYEMGRAMYEALRPGGQLILIEYRAEDPAVLIKPLHKMSEAQAKREMQALGLRWVRTDDLLPQQHFMVFEKPAGVATP